MTEPDQPIVPGTPPQAGTAICPHVSALSPLSPPTGDGSIGHRTLGAVHLDPVVTVVAHDGDRSAGLTKLAEGALLLVDAAKAFELGMHTVGCILVGKAAAATCEGARLLRVDGSAFDVLYGAPRGWRLPPGEPLSHTEVIPGNVDAMLAELTRLRRENAQLSQVSFDGARAAQLRVQELNAQVAVLHARVDVAERAMAEETRRAAAMQHERDEYAVDNEAWRSEALRLRARVNVEASDVEQSGVTWAHVTGWLSARGWAAGRGRGLAYNDGGPFCHWKSAEGWHVCVFANESPGCVADAIGLLARIYKRPGLDILDEMAAIGRGEVGL